jgi:hypothetical protein
MRPVLFAVALVIAVLTIVYFSQPRVGEIPQTRGSIFYKNAAPALKVPARTVQNSREHIHENHDHEGKLPSELEEYLEEQRAPASEIPVIIHGNGRATAYPTNQWSTVMMMVIDEDGTRRMVERQITPDGTLVIPEK